MNKSQERLRFWIAAAMLVWATLWIAVSATAAPLAAGLPLPTMSLNDQHGKLRERPFPIALVREHAQVAQVADIPRTAGSATVLRLEGGRVVQVATARQAAELRALLGLTANPAVP